MFDGKPFSPNMNLGMNVRAEALEMEKSLYTRRLEVAKRYARENKLNNVVFGNPNAWLGIITAGKTYNDLRQSFLELGLDDDALRRYGVRILKMGMLFPMEPTVVREFAQGLEEIFVIEEKRPFLEMFAKSVLYGTANAPRIVGKFDEEEKELLPHYGEFESDVIGRALTGRLSRKARIESAETWLARLDEIHARSKLPTAARTAWYCSGCPHNSSTAGGRGQRRLGRHRLPHDGDVDGPQRRDGHAHGRRRRAVDRHGAVHRHQAHLSEHGRRHLCAFGQPGDPLLRGDRHQHHVQGAAQLAHVDDRWPGDHGRGIGGRDGVRAAGQRRQEGHRHHRQPRQLQGRQPARAAPRSGTATAWTRRSARWRRPRARRC